MCSIAGAPSHGEVAEMLATMRHRAPDGSRIVSGKEYSIGMGRLAIIDLVNDEYPFCRDGHVLTFNGEIYNYKKLRKELAKKGHLFTTQGDTEVLLNGYLEWGEGVLNRLNGMFAFAIQKPNGDIFAARDLAGEKPFYFTMKPFRFASEAKALNWEGVELPRARQLYYTAATGDVSIREWYVPAPVQVPETMEEAVQQLGALLHDSIALRTQSDVPYGLYLSDGVDSNLISTFHEFDHTYTFTDGDYAAIFKDTLPRLVYHLDYPVRHFSAFALWQLAERARGDGVKVILSGDGADELFGGYVRYLGDEFNRTVQEAYPSYAAMYPVQDIMQKEFDGNLQELLRMSDRMSSAHGVEVRCPFLDRRVIEFANAIPREWKIKGTDTKIILRALLKKRWSSFPFIEKRGLFCSVNKWLGVDDPLDKTVYLNMQNQIWAKMPKRA